MDTRPENLSPNERFDWLRLIRSQNVGPITFFALLHHFGSAGAALEGASKMVLLGGLYGPDIAIVAGFGALIGHLFPVWIGFRGGKGVATAAGIALGLSWPTGLTCFAIWLLVLLITRLSSLAALIATLALPGLAYWFANPQIAEFSALITAIVWLRHSANIHRLLNGTESRVGDKSVQG